MNHIRVSILVYRSTQLERKHKIDSEHTLSTRLAKPKLFISFPSSFTYLSLFTGVLNTGGGYLRFRRIHFLEIPTIPWLYQALRGGGKASEELKALLEAEWMVAVNDWSSLFLAITFFVAAGFNFATVRQLMLRDRWEREALLPVGSPLPHQQKHRPNASLGSWHAHMVEDGFVNGDVGSPVARHTAHGHGTGKSFAVSNHRREGSVVQKRV